MPEAPPDLKIIDPDAELPLACIEVNLNGEAGASNATTGGLKGSRIKFTAIAANLYAVEGQLVGGGSIATPFDAQ